MPWQLPPASNFVLYVRASYFFRKKGRQGFSGRGTIMTPDSAEREGGKGGEAQVLQPGLALWRGRFSPQEQETLVELVLQGLAAAPLFVPRMPRSGKPFSVRMSNFGPLGWVADPAGYRYQFHHPDTGRPWPAMPQMLVDLWHRLAPGAPAPEACLINHYSGRARMGLHQDRDEANLAAPVISVSLGDAAVFRYKGESRRGPSASVRLESGDVVVMAGESRLAYHGIDRVIPGSSSLLDDTLLGGGRLNLTLRRVNP